ncbi:MAG: MmcQ/YjbR family DNA-binding protein [Candidatus Kapaibacterium sp.]
MTIPELREYCRAKKGVSEELPFSDDVPVYKVMGKMYALVPLMVDVPRINLKCLPEESLERRARYEAVQLAYHMNKQHWITALCDGTIPREELCQWIDRSYELVVQKLTKAMQKELSEINE